MERQDSSFAINSPNGLDIAYHPESYSKSENIKLMVRKEKLNKKLFSIHFEVYSVGNLYFSQHMAL